MCHAWKRSQAFMWIATETDDAQQCSDILLRHAIFMCSMFICRPNAITSSCRFECLTHHCSVRLSFVGWFWLLAHICQQLIYLPIPRYSQRCWTAFPALKQKQKDPVSIETLMARQNQCKLFCGFLKNILHCGRLSSAKWQSKQKLHLSFKSAIFIFFRHLE
jgi:hypothetical protein